MVHYIQSRDEHVQPDCVPRKSSFPQSRFDPVAASLLPSFWDPNNPGDNITGVNNFRVGFFQTYNYYNFSERVDYNINDNWRVFGRIGRYHTEDLQDDPTPNNSQLFVPTGTLREATQISGDAVWTVTPTTVVNFHGDWHKVVDAYVSETAAGRRMGQHMAEQQLVRGLPEGVSRRSSVLPEPRHRRQRISAAAASTGTRRRKARLSMPRFRSSAARIT